MESSAGTGEAIHGAPDASLTRSPQPEPVCDQHSLPLSRSSSLLQQKRSSLPPRTRSGARHAKRLTLNFPINIPLDQPPAAAADPLASPESMTPVTHSSTRPSPALPVGTPLPFDTDDDGYDFLRAIASQERRVMELREELNRAETELSTLKKQWALSEKSKKRTEINHHAEPLLPLRSPEFSGSDPSNASLHLREQSMSSVGSSSVSQERRSRELELERRTSLRAAANPPKGTTISANGRRVFQGSHARTLSLLSPVTAPSPSSDGPGPVEVDRVGRTPRSATLPSVERNSVASIGMPTDESQVPEHVLAQWRKTMPPPSREALMRTGKQMASDLREGLWTFFEDIRQATVGEEGINATESRTMSPNSLAPPTSRKRDSLQAKSRSRDRLSAVGNKSSRSSSSSSSRGRGPAAETTSGKDTTPADISKSFWHEFGVDSPAQMSPGARRSPTNNTANDTIPRGENEPEHPDHRSGSPVETEDDTMDNWDMWDTPLPAAKMKHTPSSSRSTVESSKHDQSPTTQGSSPRTSASFGDWNPSIAAPDPGVTEGIPWPAITKLAPSKLQRTASNLMAEWERSLSPSPERQSSVASSKSSKKD
ncbi:hypothetical protein N7532_007711 [Penicillium argentinense]|uniref:DUF4048 domain-containing protein n=1 Tax=Penicillium argentinense TaxID=1131581 RepID=A0A9W9K1U4_9EURO|nr:uncharacterized protein N7532_007711 [Penicillium argentinense]KAJ5089027.1 hypothetical protein N7532_007711 [Penicillium argentinense]